MYPMRKYLCGKLAKHVTAMTECGAILQAKQDDLCATNTQQRSMHDGRHAEHEQLGLTPRDKHSQPACDGRGAFCRTLLAARPCYTACVWQRRENTAPAQYRDRALRRRWRATWWDARAQVGTMGPTPRVGQPHRAGQWPRPFKAWTACHSNRATAFAKEESVAHPRALPLVASTSVHPHHP